jgi:hypothetical protein
MFLSGVPLLLLLSSLRPSYGLIGYDCGSKYLNVTTLSLLNVGECNIPYSEPNVTKTYIQLLQLDEYTNSRVKQCKLEVQRSILYCGAFSHTSAVANGYIEYLEELTLEQCERMHSLRAIRFGYNVEITGLGMNQTTSRAITFAGKIGYDGQCSGTVYSDPYGTWENVIVQGFVKITLQEYYAAVNLNTNKIYLRSGVTCP